jgi:hypothetical protein
VLNMSWEGQKVKISKFFVIVCLLRFVMRTWRHALYFEPIFGSSWYFIFWWLDRVLLVLLPNSGLVHYVLWFIYIYIYIYIYKFLPFKKKKIVASAVDSYSFFFLSFLPYYRPLNLFLGIRFLIQQTYGHNPHMIDRIGLLGYQVRHISILI